MDDHLRKNAAFVMTAMSHRRAFATTAPIAPIGTDSRQRRRTRGFVLKSDSISGECPVGEMGTASVAR
jgi:hypothetical protein